MEFSKKNMSFCQILRVWVSRVFHIPSFLQRRPGICVKESTCQKPRVWTHTRLRILLASNSCLFKPASRYLTQWQSNHTFSRILSILAGPLLGLDWTLLQLFAQKHWKAGLKRKFWPFQYFVSPSSLRWNACCKLHLCFGNVRKEATEAIDF